MLVRYYVELLQEAEVAENRDTPDVLPSVDLNEEVPKYKRQILDRRGLLHGVSFTTAESTGESEDWLAANCEGKWSLELEGVNDSLSKRTYLALFEFEADKKLFMELLSDQGGRRKP